MELIYSYTKFNNKGGFDNKSVEKNAMQFPFPRYIEGAFGGDFIKPTENALINTRRQVYEHYTYARTNNDALALIEDNGTDNDDGDEGDLELDNFMERD